LRGTTRSCHRELLLASGLAGLCALMFGPISAGGQEVVDDLLGGLAEWAKIESVLTHPRCLNCHTITDYPTQDVKRVPHTLLVRRGPNGHGATMKCQACHGEGNRAGVPGARDWYMAPLSLGGEKAPGERASSAAICATLKHGEDDDGQPDFEGLIEYAQFASFVQWAWEPGKRRDGTNRSTPPLSHNGFVDSVKRWISAGAPCPPLAPMPSTEVTAATPSSPAATIPPATPSP
jgi:hypothetical protein